MTITETDAPIATIDTGPRLVGARCTGCATHVFPRQRACPRCGAAMEAVALPAAGTLWSWTVQRFEPKPPYIGAGAFEPFAIGYVHLGPVVVEAVLTGRAVESWAIDDPVRLRVDDLDEDGHARTYRFEADQR